MRGLPKSATSRGQNLRTRLENLRTRLLEYFLICDLTRDIQLAENLMDTICWKWTSNRVFTTASAYRSFFIGQHPVEGAKLLRKTRVLAKCKFFIWLVLHDRFWTTARRKKHGLQDDDTCVMCAQMSETVDHLFTTCPFSREVWFCMLRRLGWETLVPDTQSTFFATCGLLRGNKFQRTTADVWTPWLSSLLGCY